MFHISPEFYYIIIFSLISFLIGYLSSVKKINLEDSQKTAVKSKKTETVKTSEVVQQKKVVQTPTLTQNKKVLKKQADDDGNDEDRLDFNTIVPGQIRAIKTIDRKRKIETIDKNSINKTKNEEDKPDF